MSNSYYQFYQGRKLPHWQPEEGTFFITFRLYGSIPKIIIDQLKAEYKLTMDEIRQLKLTQEDVSGILPKDLNQYLTQLRQKKEREAGKRYFASFDTFLDSNLNEPHWLKQPLIADLNAENFQFYAKKYFHLWAYTIMSNHVHLLITMKPGAPGLWKVLQDMKKYSGRQSNHILGREGLFWERESYDHLVRPSEFERILMYILNNPVKAGIVSKWQDYPYNFCHPSLL